MLLEMLRCARRRMTPEVISALLRTNFASFSRTVFQTLNPGTRYLINWHNWAIAFHLEEVRAGRIKRLIINMPPRSLKSTAASVAFPAFLHGHDPSLAIISVTYAQDLSIKLHNDYRAIITSRWYGELFPSTRIDRRKDSEGEVLLTGRGSRLATSIGGTLTGRGADIIIIDDPLKPSDAYSDSRREAVNEWFGSTLSSRLNDKVTGAIVIVTQRLHVHDLVGHVLDTSGEDWTVLNLPAIAVDDEVIQLGGNRQHRRSVGDVLHPEREPREVLDRLRRDLGSDAFEAQYQQNPAPPGGAMFKRRWLVRYAQIPTPLEGDVIIQSWDTASKTGPASDWSVCTTWLIRSGQYYLLDTFREKLDYPQLRSAALRLARLHSPRMVLIEDAGVGTGLIAELRTLGVNVSSITSSTSKEARAAIQSGKLEGGRVQFPERAQWLSELESELFSFPGSRHDDQVDSIVQALAYEPEEAGGYFYINLWPKRPTRYGW